MTPPNTSISSASTAFSTCRTYREVIITPTRFRDLTRLYLRGPGVESPIKDRKYLLARSGFTHSAAAVDWSIFAEKPSRPGALRHLICLKARDSSSLLKEEICPLSTGKSLLYLNGWVRNRASSMLSIREEFIIFGNSN
ncbi:hypothetical protein J6590_090112 [Homalodisca vitripennis]|nr:hypothetical protein J6590_090112 [Homalodisca vitripennis]